LFRGFLQKYERFITNDHPPMPTPHELLHTLLLPALVAVVIASIAAWRRWSFAMPLAPGVAFLVAYASLGVPRFPPSDGSDWLFWLAIPLTLLALVDSLITPRLGWLLGAAAGVVAFVLIKPLPDVPVQTLWMTSIVFAVAGAALTFTASISQPRLGSLWTLAPFCVVTAGAGVLILSSDSRTIGMHGLAAAAALGPVVLLSARLRVARSVAILAAPLLAGLLVAGHFYASVTCIQMTLLLATPLILLPVAFVPLKRVWLRGVIVLLAAMIATAAITTPAALAAKKAAQADPYADFYK
jgi:hypothetical protein